MYVLFADSDCDVTPVDVEHYGLHLISMPYSMGDKEIYPYEDFKVFKSKEFYNKLRSGVVPKTSAISPVKYAEYFEPFLKEGKDILYVHFSKAMSGTFNAMNIAIEDLKEKYPDRTIYTLDTKAITVLGLNIVRAIGDLYLKGATIEEIFAWADKEILKYAVYFYADDLKFFAKSGRVTNFAAFMGGMINLKPIIYINDDGQMVSVGKGLGRITTLKKIVNIVKSLEDNIKDHRIFIAHADNMELATKLNELLEEEFGKLDVEYIMVNPTAGSHCGPDAIGISFHAKHR